jgi:hypothetical protein
MHNHLKKIDIKRNIKIMNFFFNNLYCIFFIILISVKPVYAYIDPGTGSTLVYIVTGIVVAVFFTAKGIFYKLIDFLSLKKNKQEECYIAIHSESPRYDITFLPIMRHLSRLNADYTYFTMYKRDGTFEELPKGAKHKEIKPGIVGYSFLNILKAKLLLTTTPQLDIMTFKRSKYIEHYCIVQHALGESMFVRPFAYDNYDSVFCCGEILARNLRQIEIIRNAKPKKLYKTGIPHYDELINRKQDLRKTDGKKTILIAPSWGELSLFNKFGTDFINHLTNNYNIIIRPHPQMKISQVELYEKIININGVQIDIEDMCDNAMSKADLLISDFSGIIHEFAFIYERPVLVVDYEKNLEGFDGFLLKKESEIKERSKDFIYTIKPENFINLEHAINIALQNFSVETVRRIRNELIFNFGRAGEVAAQQIMEILECQ